MPFRFLAVAVAAVMMWSGQANAAPKSDLWAFWDAAGSRDTVPVDDAPWAAILSKYRSVGSDGVARFDYGGVSAEDKAALDRYLAAKAASDIRTYTRARQMPFWVNLYNALTVKVILDHYPVDSITDIDISPGFFSNGPWGAKLITIEGQELSLDDVEHRILRPIWKDPRIHYAVNCASIGCPDLAAEPFSAEAMEQMLDAGARGFVNHPRGVGFYNSGKLKVSSIYDWFEEDFDGSEAGVIKHVLHYAEPELAAKIRASNDIGGDAYDWSLNKP